MDTKHLTNWGGLTVSVVGEMLRALSGFSASRVWALSSRGRWGTWWGGQLGAGKRFTPLLPRIVEEQQAQGEGCGQQGVELTGRPESGRQFHESQVLAASSACSGGGGGPPGKGWDQSVQHRAHRSTQLHPRTATPPTPPPAWHGGSWGPGFVLDQGFGGGRWPRPSGGRGGCPGGGRFWGPLQCTHSQWRASR